MLHVGDCLDILPSIAGASVDAVVTDPPYSLSFMGREWDKFRPSEFQAWCEKWAAECLRVLRPGGHLVAFGGTRTYHRLACAIEDAGFEVRDSLHWIYGSGFLPFPKSLDVGKAIDKAAGAQREVVGPSARHGGGANDKYAQDDWTRQNAATMGMVITAPATDAARQWDGWGTALKPAHEPIILARKPLASTVAGNVLAHGTGALNIDACRVEGVPPSVPQPDFRRHNGVTMTGLDAHARNGEMSTAAGRWPPNVLLGPEAAAELDRQSGNVPGSHIQRPTHTNGGFGGGRKDGTGFGDKGGASRFFPCFRYQAKAPASERPAADDGTGHPTVKPLALMQWLVRLVTPPGGLILDPFAGTGTTGEAAILEGFHYVLIEKDPASAELIRRRLSKPLQRGLEGLPAS